MESCRSEPAGEGGGKGVAQLPFQGDLASKRERRHVTGSQTAARRGLLRAPLRAAGRASSSGSVRVSLSYAPAAVSSQPSLLEEVSDSYQ